MNVYPFTEVWAPVDGTYWTSQKSEDDDKYIWSRVKGPDKRPLSLLLVSKQTYPEAYHIFYRHNNRQFPNVCYLWQFLKNIGYARRQYVTHITLVWMGLATNAAFPKAQVPRHNLAL